MTDIKDVVSRRVMNTYRRYPVTLIRGEGMHLFDDAGRRYLDFTAGIAVVAVGHSHPKITEAVTKQISTLTHVSNLYYTEPMAKLADRLLNLLGWTDGRVFFANSGAEANECAIKLVRKWARGKYEDDRYETIATLGSFHGRTLETLAATGQPKKWEGFTPLPPGFKHVAYNDASAIESAIDSKVASVLLEPVQGEGGVVVPGDDYLPAVRKVCDTHGLAFIADEVQTGLGRIGHWFGFQSSGSEPDVITLAKALGNGLPVGACAAQGEFAEALVPGDHATTVGGGPVICAAALAVLDIIEGDGLVENAARMGAALKTELESMASRRSVVKEIRGKGLLLAVQLNDEVARDVVTKCMKRGLLVNDVLPSAIRISPPLIVEQDQCDEAVSILDEVLAGFDR